MFEPFRVYAPKYAKAADCLSQDRDTLLAFYDFPAEHWKHLRTQITLEHARRADWSQRTERGQSFTRGAEILVR